jgi:hypothetical protein
MHFKTGSVRILLFKREWWTAALCLCLAGAMLWLVNYPAAVGASATTRQLPIYCVDRDDNMVAISFDAAWGDVILRQLLLLPDSYHGGNTMNCVEFW